MNSDAGEPLPWIRSHPPHHLFRLSSTYFSSALPSSPLPASLYVCMYVSLSVCMSLSASLYVSLCSFSCCSIPLLFFLYPHVLSTHYRPPLSSKRDVIIPPSIFRDPWSRVCDASFHPAAVRAGAEQRVVPRRREGQSQGLPKAAASSYDSRYAVLPHLRHSVTST